MIEPLPHQFSERTRPLVDIEQRPYLIVVPAPGRARGRGILRRHARAVGVCRRRDRRRHQFGRRRRPARDVSHTDLAGRALRHRECYQYPGDLARHAGERVGIPQRTARRRQASLCLDRPERHWRRRRRDAAAPDTPRRLRPAGACSDSVRHVPLHRAGAASTAIQPRRRPHRAVTLAVLDDAVSVGAWACTAATSAPASASSCSRRSV